MEKITAYLIFCTLSATLASFVFGYHSGVINQPRAAMSSCSSPEPNCLPLSDMEWGVFVSVYVVGGILGGIMGGYLTTYFGRRSCLFWINVGFIAGSSLIAVGNDMLLWFLGRFLTGISSGIATVAVPLYISEVTPLSYRGTFGSLNQLFCVIGILIAVILGIPWSERSSWPNLFFFAWIPSILQCCFIPFCAESPSWLVSKHLYDQARAALQRLRGTDDVEDELELVMSRLGVSIPESTITENRDEELDETTALLSNTNPKKTITNVIELFKDKDLRIPLFSAICLHLAQQFSGINAAVYYSTTLFRNNYDEATALNLTLLVSIINLIMTILSSSLIERLGRRVLLLSAEGIMLVTSIIIAISGILNFYPIVIVISIMLFVAGFGLGMGNIPWLILPELMPNHALGISSSLCTSLNWSVNFILALIMPVGYGLFFVFAFFLLFFAVFTYYILPETKGKNPNDVQHD